jgi:hypothetical protein
MKGQTQKGTQKETRASVIKDTKVLKGLYSQGTTQSIRKYEEPANSSHTFFLAVTSMK